MFCVFQLTPLRKMFCVFQLMFCVFQLTPLRKMFCVFQLTPLLQLFTVLLVLAPPCIVNCDTNINDASALRVLFGIFNSPKQLTNWSSNGGDPCGEKWKGVTCLGSRVSEINLSGLGLSGLPAARMELRSLTSLTNLDISNNGFGNEMPVKLPLNLQRLNIARCGFTGTLGTVISDMSSLEYFNAASNKMTGELKEMFGDLSALSTLDLSNNLFSGPLPKTFSLMSNATNIYLNGNKFTGTIDVLANLPLVNLNIANNLFTGSIPSQLEKINLTKEGNSWNDVPPPPPGTPEAERGSPSCQPKGNFSDGGSKSNLSVGVMISIVICCLLLREIIMWGVHRLVETNQTEAFQQVELASNTGMMV